MPATACGARFGWLVPVLATAGGLFSAAYSIRLVHDAFFSGPPRDLAGVHPHEPPWGMKAPVVLLVAVCIAVGLMPFIAEPLVRVASAAALGVPPPEFHLALWHGVNAPLLMSMFGLLAGLALYAGLRRGGRLHRYLPSGRGGKAIFTATIDGLFGAAGRTTHLLENGSLQRYTAWMVLMALALGALPFALAPDGVPAAGERTLLPATPLAIGVWLMLLVIGIALLRLQRTRFVAVVLTGAVGLVASLAFIGMSAPDLAMTQLSVDVVSTVLLLMGLALLPQTSPRESSPLRRGRDALIALAGGGGVAALTWLMLTRDHDSISWYFLENSLTRGGGTNAVNVILVDFRGYDTFGEITVLGIAAVGVLALLQGFRARRPDTDAQGRPWSFSLEPLLLRRVARLVLPIALVLSVYIYWRGHNLPGGGFIAGLVTAGGAGAAVHGAGPAACREPAARRGRAALHALDRHRAGHRLADRRGRLLLRPALPDQRARPPVGAGAGRAAAGHRRALRPGRVHHRGRRDDADAVGAGRGQQGTRGRAPGRKRPASPRGSADVADEAT